MSELERSLTAIDWLPRLNAVEAMKQHSDTGEAAANEEQTCSSTALLLVDNLAKEIEEREKKPPHSYATLIKMAINSTPKRQMTLSEIYQWVCENFEYYKRCTHNGWKNSIRHNLSLNKSFTKVPRPQHDPGKGCYWTIDTSNSMSIPSKKKKKKNAPLLAVAPYIPERDGTSQVQCEVLTARCPGKNLLEQHPNLAQLITGKTYGNNKHVPCDPSSSTATAMKPIDYGEIDTTLLRTLLEIPPNRNAQTDRPKTSPSSPTESTRATLDLPYLDFIPDEFTLDMLPLTMTSLRSDEIEEELQEIEFDWDSLL